jgi:hypothetical protein
VPQDYLLRLIEQVAQMLAAILGLRRAGRNAEAAEQIRQTCLQTTGLPFDVVKHSAPEQLWQLLASGGGTQHARAVMLAELLMQDAELADLAGNERECLISRVQARALLAPTLEKLSPEEQAIYQPKLETLAAQIGSNKGPLQKNED